MATITSAALRAQADRRIDAAVDEAAEQMTKGWLPGEIVAVLTDAMGPISDLLDQADAVDEMNHELTKPVTA